MGCFHGSKRTAVSDWLVNTLTLPHFSSMAGHFQRKWSDLVFSLHRSHGARHLTISETKPSEDILIHGLQELLVRDSQVGFLHSEISIKVADVTGRFLQSHFERMHQPSMNHHPHTEGKTSSLLKISSHCWPHGGSVTKVCPTPHCFLVRHAPIPQ